MRITFKEIHDTCPNGHTLEMRDDQFFYNGKHYPGLVCPICNSLWAMKGKNLWEEHKMKDESMFMCVNCGEPATKGFMKHPYCKKCYGTLFKNSHGLYCAYVAEHHEMNKNPYLTNPTK